MEGPEKVDETTPIEINSESKVAKGGLKNSLRKARKPIGYCGRFFQSLFVRFIYWVAFMNLITTFYPVFLIHDPLDSSSRETSKIITICIVCAGVALFAEFIHNVKWKKCTDNGFISPTVCLIIGFMNILVVVLPFVVGFEEEDFEGAIQKGLKTPLIPHRYIINILYLENSK